MNALTIKQLTKTYQNGVVALKGIDLEVKEGDFFALLGPNGAGKSTTIGVIAGLVNKSSGKVVIFDKDLDNAAADARGYLGIVPQEFNFSIFEKLENILINQAGYYGMPRALAKEAAHHFLNELGLWEKRNDIPQRLSGGMKRRLLIARALVHDPKLLILDEPTAGVDIEIRRSMWGFLEKINAAGKTIILTTHYLEEAEKLCKNIAIIDKGTITTMKLLLRQLNVESFVLDLVQPLETLPNNTIFKFEQIDNMTLEVEIAEKQPLNPLFTFLSEQGILVKSMRNKTNRLEELFLNLTNNKGQ